jgi:tetratricopeptide (TPR) repeat protein
MDPLSPLVSSDVGWFYYFAGQYEQAIDECLRTLELEPGFLLAHACLLEAYDRNGMPEEAFAEAQETLAAAGATESELAEIRSLDPTERRERTLRWWLIHDDDLGPYKLALIHLRLGEQGQALDWLEKSFTERDLWLPVLREDPRFDSLRSEPRYETILELLNFPGPNRPTD